jgi:hypothetical protein
MKTPIVIGVFTPAIREGAAFGSAKMHGGTIDPVSVLYNLAPWETSSMQSDLHAVVWHPMNSPRLSSAPLLVALLCLLGCIGPGAMAQPAAVPQAEVSTKVQWVTPEIKAPRVSFHTFDSAAAKARVSYHLYTPAAYDRVENTDRRFPVVYWLHGSGGGAAGIAKVAATFDAAIEAGKTPPCLVVFVNGLVAPSPRAKGECSTASAWAGTARRGWASSTRRCSGPCRSSARGRCRPS